MRLTSIQSVSRSALAMGLILVLLATTYSLGGPNSISFDSRDRGGDFLKVLLWLPGPPPVSGLLEGLVSRFGILTVHYDEIGLFHLPPFSMLLALLTRQLFGVIGPGTVYLLFLALFLLTVAAVVFRATDDLKWVLVAMLSYPLICVVDRGNLFSGLCSICILLALLRPKADWATAFLLAIAINLRPNTGLMAIPLLLIDWRLCRRLVLSSLILFVVGLAGSNQLFPDYTLEAFQGGLERYARAYVLDGAGVQFGSSLYGATFALGRPALLASTVISLVPVPLALYAHSKGRLAFDELLFICAAVTTLATAIFADYHLLIFLAPAILAKSRMVFWASVLMLAPKGLWMWGPFTAQVILNPLILITACAVILVGSLRAEDSSAPRSAGAFNRK